MLITEAKAPVDSTTGLSLDVDIELSEVLLANIQRGAVAALPQPTEGPAVDRQGDTSHGGGWIPRRRSLTPTFLGDISSHAINPAYHRPAPNL